MGLTADPAGGVTAALPGTAEFSAPVALLLSDAPLPVYAIDIRAGAPGGSARWNFHGERLSWHVPHWTMPPGRKTPRLTTSCAGRSVVRAR